MFRKISRLYRNLQYCLNNELTKHDEVVEKLSDENQMLRTLVYAYQHKQYLEEAEFLQNRKTPCVFPYPIVKRISSVESGLDESLHLPYVGHRNKRLYFLSDMSTEEAKERYRNYIEEENLLGGGYATKAPHQYLSKNVSIKDYDVLVDLGAAEGLLSLDVIDEVEHVVLVEADNQWIRPLESTFAPYREKVTIINKLASDKDSDTEVSLQSILEKFPDKRVLVKMDIEGQEMMVLNGAKAYIKARDNLGFLCCTYHKANDAQEALQLFEETGYVTEFSEGYMLFSMYDPEPLPPYFRKGVIRAYRKK